MIKKLNLKIFLLLVVLVILAGGLSKTISIYNGYSNIFRLTTSDVHNALDQKISSCVMIGDCKLMPGDILIRRYITSRTWFIDKLASPYYTHSVMYLGDDQIIEAAGTERDPDDDIKVLVFSSSDWMNKDMNDWVVIRPKKIGPVFEIIKKDLISIASDPEYLFGLQENGNKRAICSDLIFRQLSNNNIVSGVNTPNIITPDYLFWLAENNQTAFDVIGFNLQSLL